MPEVLKLYAALHEKGVEIAGVSSDVSAEKLQAYLGTWKDISWRQLYVPPLENGRHPLNAAYHVDWIPTVFIIDKQGLCRSVGGQGDGGACAKAGGGNGEVSYCASNAFARNSVRGVPLMSISLLPKMYKI